MSEEYKVTDYPFNLDESIDMVEKLFPIEYGFSKRYILSNIKQARDRLFEAEELLEKWRRKGVISSSIINFNFGRDMCADELEAILKGKSPKKPKAPDKDSIVQLPTLG